MSVYGGLVPLGFAHSLTSIDLLGIFYHRGSLFSIPGIDFFSPRCYHRFAKVNTAQVPVPLVTEGLGE